VAGAPIFADFGEELSFVLFYPADEGLVAGVFDPEQ
jgi:hypothetical protein